MEEYRGDGRTAGSVFILQQAVAAIMTTLAEEHRRAILDVITKTAESFGDDSLDALVAGEMEKSTLLSEMHGGAEDTVEMLRELSGG